MKKKDIVVVVPVYKTSLSIEEKASLDQCVSLLSEYTLIFITPCQMNTVFLQSDYPMFRIEPFSDLYFSSIRGYNKLVLEYQFYERFKVYQYLLIYQLDAYVFRDELLFWALKGYDYIGAPWLPIDPEKRNPLKFITSIKHFIYQSIGNPRYRKWKYYEYEIGNGGFSLRKISKMLDVTSYYRDKIEQLLADDAPFYPEDVFLCLEVKHKKLRLKKPRFEEAMKFSMEVGCEWAYDYNNRQLPFGCHAWYHKDYSPFWRDIIKL